MTVVKPKINIVVSDKGLELEASFASDSGADEIAEQLREELKKYGVETAAVCGLPQVRASGMVRNQECCLSSEAKCYCRKAGLR